MNCRSLTRKRPAKGKTKRADNPMATWTNEWNEKGQLPSLGESRSRSLATQEDEHNVITGMPDTRTPMITSRMRFFLVRFIKPRMKLFHPMGYVMYSGFDQSGVHFFKSFFFIPTLWYKSKDFIIRLFYTQSVAEPWFLLNLNAFPASSTDGRQGKLK